MINHDIQILVFSRDTVKEFVTDNPFIWISIRDPKSKEAEITGGPNMIASLFLEFSDFDMDMFPKLRNVPEIKPFTIEDAKSILKVVQVTEKYINTIVVNCEAGISRSAAVAAAIAKVLGQSDDLYFNPRSPYIPNRYVYHTLLNTYQDTVPIGE